jgi:hypothetical protein
MGTVRKNGVHTTPSSEHVDEDIHKLACFVSSGSSAGLGIRNDGLEHSPFIVGEVSVAGSSGIHGTATPS